MLDVLKYISPRSGSYRRGIRSSNVVFPLPDFPTIATVSPLLMSRLIFSRTFDCDDGYLKVTFLKLIEILPSIFVASIISIFSLLESNKS